MVYVDDIEAHGTVNDRTGYWCRMWADHTDELHAKARELGVGYRFFCPTPPAANTYMVRDVDLHIFQASYLVTREMAYRAVAFFGVKQMREEYAA